MGPDKVTPNQNNRNGLAEALGAVPDNTGVDKVEAFLKNFPENENADLTPKLRLLVRKGVVYCTPEGKVVYDYGHGADAQRLTFRQATGADVEYITNVGADDGNAGTATLTLIARLIGTTASDVTKTYVEGLPAKVVKAAQEIAVFLLT